MNNKLNGGINLGILCNLRKVASRKPRFSIARDEENLGFPGCQLGGFSFCEAPKHENLVS